MFLHRTGTRLQTWSLFLFVLASRWHSSFINFSIVHGINWIRFSISFLLQLLLHHCNRDSHFFQTYSQGGGKTQENASHVRVSERPRTNPQLLLFICGFVLWRGNGQPEPFIETEAAVGAVVPAEWQWMRRAGWAFLHCGGGREDVGVRDWDPGKKGRQKSVPGIRIGKWILYTDTDVLIDI